MIWTPVMEKDFGQPRFLTAHPITLIQNGEFHKVPFITGVTTDEFANKAFRKYFYDWKLKAAIYLIFFK